MSLADKSLPRILITGATGFVGPVLLNALKTGFFRDAELFVWEYNPDGETVGNQFNVDICSRQAVFSSIAAIRPTHVIHLAAQSHVPTSFAQPELTWNINVMGTLYLFEAITTYVPEAGILIISSSEVYGKSFQAGIALDENALLQPQNPYAASKAAADLMAGQYASQGLHVLRIRPFNHVGPGQREEFVVSSFAAQIARIEAGLQSPVLHVGNLQAQRDFLDVRDVVRAYVLALEHIFDLPTGLVLNICSGVPQKIEELLFSLLAQASLSIKVEVDTARMRPSDIPLAVGIAGLAKQHLGWQAEIGFEETLVAVLDDWRAKVHSEGV